MVRQAHHDKVMLSYQLPVTLSRELVERSKGDILTMTNKFSFGQQPVRTVLKNRFVGDISFHKRDEPGGGNGSGGDGLIKELVSLFATYAL